MIFSENFLSVEKFEVENFQLLTMIFSENFLSVEKFEVENFQLLTMIFSENFLSVENFLEWKWAFRLISLSFYAVLNLFSRVTRLHIISPLKGHVKLYITSFTSK
jgi:hypothetical protein